MPVGDKGEKRSASPITATVHALEVVLGIRPEEYARPPKDEEEAAERKALDERRKRLHDEPPGRATKRSAE